MWTLNDYGAYSCALRNHETFITHNGDLDFFEIHGIAYPLKDVFTLLTTILDCRPTSCVDSLGEPRRASSHLTLPTPPPAPQPPLNAHRKNHVWNTAASTLTDAVSWREGVAGLLDLLRTKGIWKASVRYGYVFGFLSAAGKLTSAQVLPLLWGKRKMREMSNMFEEAWEQVVAQNEDGQEAAISSTQSDVKSTHLARFHLHSACLALRMHHLAACVLLVNRLICLPCLGFARCFILCPLSLSIPKLGLHLACLQRMDGLRRMRTLK